MVGCVSVLGNIFNLLVGALVTASGVVMCWNAVVSGFTLGFHPFIVGVSVG